LSKSPTRILVSAYSIYVGGGAVLLNDLLEAMEESYDVLVYCDERFKPSPKIKAHVIFIRVKPLPHTRIWAEKKIAKVSERFDLLFLNPKSRPLFLFKINFSSGKSLLTGIAGRASSAPLEKGSGLKPENLKITSM
jgi:hypothetical protein